MSKELATPFDTSQIGQPYHLCTAEEKSERRKTAVRLAILMKLKKESNEKQELTVDTIAKIVGVPRSDLFRWIKMEADDPGAGMVGYKMGPKPENVKKN
jgi:hypothetical protein